MGFRGLGFRGFRGCGHLVLRQTHAINSLSPPSALYQTLNTLSLGPYMFI